MKKILAHGYLWLLLALLYAPILIIIIFSFTEAKVLGNWTGFSFKLYSSLFSGGVNSSLINAIINTILIALIAATVRRSEAGSEPGSAGQCSRVLYHYG